MSNWIDKLFPSKGNRQFSDDEEKLIDTLNELENFIADEAFIDFQHKHLFAIDKEEQKLAKLTNSEDEVKTEILSLKEADNYSLSIKDRANEEWMENFNKWKKQKKFIRSIDISVGANEKEFQLPFLTSENNDGDRASSIAVKRALFSLDKWDRYLYQYFNPED